MTNGEIFDELLVISMSGENETSIYSMYKDMSILRFKSAVASRIRDPRATAERLRLFSLGEEMSNDRTLRSYNISSGDTITYILSEGISDRERRNCSESGAPTISDDPPAYSDGPNRPIPTLNNLQIQDPNGRTHMLHNVPLDMTVRDLLLKWQEKHSVDINGLRLIYGSKQLDVEKKNVNLMDYGIKEDSTLFAVIRVPGGKKCYW